MAKKEDSKKGPGPDENQGPTNNGDIQTVEDLEDVFPKLVTVIRDDLVKQIEKATAEQIKTNMPELYDRIVTHIQSKGGPNLNVPGFLLEVDDPFARGTLEQYEILQGLKGLRLPYVLPFKVKGQAPVNRIRLTKKFQASEDLKVEFKDIEKYLTFKSRIITQVLEFYILIAEGGGDYARANEARKAMKKIK